MVLSDPDEREASNWTISADEAAPDTKAQTMVRSAVKTFLRTASHLCW
jgi:hypothetical protein